MSEFNSLQRMPKYWAPANASVCCFICIIYIYIYIINIYIYIYIYIYVYIYIKRDNESAPTKGRALDLTAAFGEPDPVLGVLCSASG